MATAPGPRNRPTNAGVARSSGASGNLTAMVDDDAIIAAVTDPDGHQVVLLARIWEQKITVDHPELARHKQAVMETVPVPITSRSMRCQQPERGSTVARPARADGCSRS